MKFLVDAQLPARLASWLRERGYDVIHTDGLALKNRTPDSALITLAKEEQRILITKDSDFQLSYELGHGPTQLLLITTGNIHNNELLELFAKHETVLFGLFSRHQFIELGRSDLIIHR